MYNTTMKSFLPLLLVLLSVSGCAMNEAYNPVAAQSSGTYELNASGLKKAQPGMTQDAVHELLGESMVIGYNYPDNATNKGAPTPITLKNPYKTSDVQTDKGACTAEYYVTSVVIPDGVVSDKELLPLIFCKGVLTYKGWDKLK